MGMALAVNIDNEIATIGTINFESYSHWWFETVAGGLRQWRCTCVKFYIAQL
jgi:hypothetical protein